MSNNELTIEPESAIRTPLSPTRDWEIVRWVGRMGAVTLDQLRVRFGLGRTAAYRRVAACVEGKLLERVDLLRGQPALLRATRRGLRLTRLPLGPAHAPPELVGHWIACGWVALALEDEFGADAVRSEREIRLEERWTGQAIASAKLGQHADGPDRLHRPDLAVVGRGGVVAIEVELTSKAPKRLDAIVKAWRRARWVESVRYYALEGTTQDGLRRAIERTRAGERVEMRSLGSPVRLGPPEASRSGTAR